MAENMMNKSHISSNQASRDGWERTFGCKGKKKGKKTKKKGKK